MSEAQRSDRALIGQAQQGDAEAMEQLTARHDALVKYVARRFLGRGVEQDDLYQLGRLGLVKAIRGFDTRFDVKFSTYAVPLIMGEIRRHLRDDGAVHVSRAIRTNALRIARLMQQDGDALTAGEAAQRLGISPEDAVLAMGSLHRPRSLTEPVSQDGTLLLQDTLGSDQTEETVEHIQLRMLLARLPKEDRELILRRYFRDETQTVIARSRGVTQVQISRAEARILRRLREQMQ